MRLFADSRKAARMRLPIFPRKNSALCFKPRDNSQTLLRRPLQGGGGNAAIRLIFLRTGYSPGFPIFFFPLSPFGFPSLLNLLFFISSYGIFRARFYCIKRGTILQKRQFRPYCPPRFDAGDIRLNSRRLRGSFIHRPKQAAKKRLNPSKASPAARSPES